MTFTDYSNKIDEFNKNTSIIEYRERCYEPSFFEIISKERSETTYSSFLKWLFKECSTSVSEISPILLLLDILVKKGGKGFEGKKDLQISVLSRTLQVNTIAAYIEQSVAKLSKEASELENDALQKDKASFEQHCKDKIDLFIRCQVEIDGVNKELQIIIENKIDSNEGVAKQDSNIPLVYSSASQTKRYYIGTKIKNSTSLYQLYVYLTPDWTNSEGIDENFIHVNYQEILNSVIEPLLSSSSLSDRNRFFLEEFKNQLLFPSLEDKKNLPIATPPGFKDIWEGFGTLIINSIIASSDKSFYKFEDKYYQDYPTNDFAASLKQNSQEFVSHCQKVNNPKKSTLEKFANKSGLPKPELVIIDEKVKGLLIAFGDHNRTLLSAIIRGVVKNDSSLEVFRKEIDKRDTTKYTLLYNGQIIGSHLSKRKVVMESFKTLGTDLEQTDSTNRPIYIPKESFEYSYNNKQPITVKDIDITINEDMYSNRYTIVKCSNNNEYYVNNQWGASENWNKLVITLRNKGFLLIPE